MNLPRRQRKKRYAPGVKKEQIPLSVSQLESEQPPQTREETAVISVRETEQIIAELMGTIGHEFRTPLAAIKGYSSMLLRQEDQLSDEERREFLQFIQQAGQRLETLTNRLLQMTNLEAGTFQIDSSFVDIPTLTREAIVRAQQQIATSLSDRWTFHLHLRDMTRNPVEDVPPIKGDRRSLRTVLEHLLENAVHFSPEGGRIDIIIQPIPPAQTSQGNEHQTASFLEICVCDYGVGIPNEHLEHIFERFYRVDTSLTREVNGLGLGLAICAHLVALHQGRIWAESCAAGGSAFHLWLPIAEPILMD